ncbi:PREDICTED: strigolactone esterase D14-like [Nelumbo nucifera]|nr:PREDICTED: strigolactone esterase D14-like [Nelumbo nucifera]
MFMTIESNFSSWVPKSARLLIDEEHPLALEKYEKCLGRMRPEIALSLAKTIFLSDVRDVLEWVQVPCTIVQTSHDSVIPISVARYMQSKIKGESTPEIIENDGHYPQLTAPCCCLMLLPVGRVIGVSFDDKTELLFPAADGTSVAA